MQKIQETKEKRKNERNRKRRAGLQFETECIVTTRLWEMVICWLNPSNVGNAMWFNPAYEMKIKHKLSLRDKDYQTGFKTSNSNNHHTD